MIEPTSAAPDDTPEIVIRPRPGWVPLDVRELWAYRELTYFLIWRDLKVRYRQTAFGALWAIAQPLLLMLVFTVFLSRLSGITPEGVPYPLFAFAALIPWTLFSQSIVGASNSLVQASNLLQKVYFPRLLLPAAAVGSYVVDFLLGIVVLGGFMAWYGVVTSLAVLWVVPLAGLTVLTALAFGVWLSAVNVRYRDVRYAVPFIVQLWLFATPVAYASEVIPPEWRFAYAVNPMAGIIEGFRWALFGGASPPVLSLIASSVVVTVVLVSGLLYFRDVERTFADVI